MQKYLKKHKDYIEQFKKDVEQSGINDNWEERLKKALSFQPLCYQNNSNKNTGKNTED